MQLFFKKKDSLRFKIPRAAYALAAAALAAYVVYLFAAFAAGTRDGYSEARPGRAESADAIVVLTGGKGTISEGIALLRAGKGKTLIISGVAAEAGVDSIFRGKLTREELANVILEKRSRSTYRNAVEVRRLVEDRGFRSVALITSVYHMKRAAYIFRHVLPKGVAIEPYFVTTPNFDENRWWEAKSIGILAVEFVKYCWYEMRFALEGVWLSGGNP